MRILNSSFSLLLVAIAALATVGTAVRATERQGDHLRIAAASDLKFALDQLKAEFVKTHPGVEIEVVTGSSGQFEQQIEKGAPFDLFLSADESYPKMLNAKGLTVGATWQYGTGTLVLWTKQGSGIDVKKGLSVLTDTKVKKIAIANPEHAPYGKAAKEALEKAKLYDSVKSKLVLGDSISQTAQFAQTGAADVGLIALALAKSPEMKGTYEIIKEATPLVQAGVVLKQAEKKASAKEFSAFMTSDKGADILKSFGFKAENSKGVQ